MFTTAGETESNDVVPATQASTLSVTTTRRRTTAADKANMLWGSAMRLSPQHVLL
jgi:hypothetical protein